MSFTQRVARFAGVPAPMRMREVLQIIDEDISRGPGQEAPGIAVQAVREHAHLWRAATGEVAAKVGTKAINLAGITLDVFMEGPKIHLQPIQKLGEIGLGPLSQAMDFVFGPEDPHYRGKFGLHD